MDSNTHSARQPASPSAGHPARHPAEHVAGQPVRHGASQEAGHCAGQPASQSTGPPAGRPDGLAAFTAAVDALAAQDLTGLADPVAAQRVLGLRRLLDRLEGHGLEALAAVDAPGAAGADQGLQAPPRTSWLRARLRLGAGTATSQVRTARALCRGPLTHTGQALTDGAITPAQASVVASGTQDLPAQLGSRPNRCWWRPPTGWTGPAAGGAPASAAGGRSGGAEPRPTASTNAGAGGWRPPWRAWSPWRGGWSPRPTRPWRPWSRWPAPTAPPMRAAGASAGPMP
jgi:hypothetical protein